MSDQTDAEKEAANTIREHDDARDQLKDTMSHSAAQAARQGQITPEKSASRVPMDSHAEEHGDSRPDWQRHDNETVEQPES